MVMQYNFIQNKEKRIFCPYYYRIENCDIIVAADHIYLIFLCNMILSRYSYVLGVCKNVESI